MESRRCGNCRFWKDSDKLPANIIERARYKAKHQFPICEADGRRRDADDKPCLIWMRKEKE